MTGTGLTVRATVADRGIDLEFAVEPGQVVAVIGPNGAGKSSVLHVIAGLLKPDSGTVTVGQRRLTDVDAGIDVPVYDRRVGLLLQDAALFPHLNVAANVGFGPRSRQRSTHHRSLQAARRWLTEVGASELSDRMPNELSGGQAQRVALARALAAEPEVVLLDEPLSGLDVSAASAMRTLLRGALTTGGRCAVLISHDLLDVVTLADRVVIIEHGRIVESCSVTDILTVPRTAFGARFAGMNLMAGIAGSDGTAVSAAQLTWHGRPTNEVSGGPAIAVFAPAAVTVSRDEPADRSPDRSNVIAVTVAELDHRGPVIRVRTEPLEDGTPGLAADISTQAAAALRIVPGEAVYFCVAEQDVAIQPA